GRDAGLRGLGNERQQDAGDGGGLAGAGAAGDEQQGVVECGVDGLGLEVVGGCRGKRGFGRRDRGVADAVEAGGEAAFVFAVAAQVDQAVFVDERGVGGGFGFAGVGV